MLKSHVCATQLPTLDHMRHVAAVWLIATQVVEVTKKTMGTSFGVKYLVCDQFWSLTQMKN